MKQQRGRERARRAKQETAEDSALILALGGYCLILVLAFAGSVYWVHSLLWLVVSAAGHGFHLSR